jgi:hypothetical protein
MLTPQRFKLERGLASAMIFAGKVTTSLNIAR